MFGGFPKLFDRSFFIGYFLPAFLLFVGLVANLFAFGYIDENTKLLGEKSTLGATISLVIIWLLSILLMTFNRPIIRLLEGYGELNPFRIFLPSQQQEFKTKAEPHLRKLDRVLDARRRGVPELEEFNELSVWNAVRNFPEELDLVLSTRLGNVMRAYERYSDLVYGIEAIALWPRLFMIIPEEARERIRESEALFHFSINMLFTSLFTILTSGTMITSLLHDGGFSVLVSKISWLMTLVLGSGFFFAWYSWWVLPQAARQRGEQVKSTFDLYRSKLAEALGFELPATEAEERRLWRLVSRRMLLRVSDDRLSGYRKSLDDFRKKATDTPPDMAKSLPQSAPSTEKDEKEEAESKQKNLAA
jgi:hypothetical protein